MIDFPFDTALDFAPFPTNGDNLFGDFTHVVRFRLRPRPAIPGESPSHVTTICFLVGPGRTPQVIDETKALVAMGNGQFVSVDRLLEATAPNTAKP